MTAVGGQDIVRESQLIPCLYADSDLLGLIGRLTGERIEWVVPPGLHHGGTYQGREEILDNVFSRFVTEWRGFNVASEEILDAGNGVVSLGHYSGTNLTTGSR
ncbi:nuclear transport factor 2 family protein [Streptomyces sp. NPDC017260]